MNSRPPFRRRNYFIKKRFQLDFSAKFLIIIVLEAALAAGLFLYLSKGTLTAGYAGAELKVARTYDFFLPLLLLSNLIIVAITAAIGIIVFIFLSHRLAGPLYRFEKVLSDLGKGDLTQRFKLREKDEFIELEKGINALSAVMDKNIGEVKSGIAELAKTVSEIKAAAANPSARQQVEKLLQEASDKLKKLEESANYFKTSL